MSGVDESLKKKLNPKKNTQIKPQKTKALNTPSQSAATSKLNVNAGVGIKKGKKQQATSNDSKSNKVKDIQEDLNEERDSNNTTELDGNVDPDTRMIEEFHKKTLEEPLKWENSLDTQGN